MDHPHLSYDPGIFVTTVKETGVAGRDGRMHPGDKILEVISEQALFNDVVLSLFNFESLSI